MALFAKKIAPYIDPLQDAKDAALGATFAFQHAVNELIDANGVLAKIKEDVVSTISGLQARHDEAHTAQTQNAHAVGKLKELLGLED